MSESIVNCIIILYIKNKKYIISLVMVFGWFVDCGISII